MRAHRTGLWWVPLAVLAVMWSGQAWAFGGLVTPDGNGMITASRAMVVRGAGEVVINLQARYQGTPTSAVWLIPLPNFTEPADDGVRSGVVPQAPLDELAMATWPVLSGQCDDMPTGAVQQVPQIEQYGPANQAALPTRFFTVTDVTMGNLDNYLDGLGITLDMAMADAVNRVIDENFMIAAVRIDTTELGVNRIDPIVSLRYPAEAGDQIKLGLRLLAPSSTTAADLVMWAFDSTRVRANFPTDELRYEDIRFISPTETDYVPAFDMQVSAQQTQRFIIENARAVDGATFVDGDLAAAAASGFMTRLRARMLPAALRNNLAFIVLREAGNGEVPREHAVQGYMCGGEPDPDAGVEPEPDGGGEPEPGADMDPVDSMDGGPLTTDAGGDGGGGGGGGAGGCVAAPGRDGARWPLLILLSLCLCLPGIRRRG